MKKKLTEFEKLDAIQEELREAKTDKISRLTKKWPSYTEPLRALKTSATVAASLSAATLFILVFGAIRIASSKIYLDDYGSIVSCILALISLIYVFELYVFIKIARFNFLPSKIYISMNIVVALNIAMFVSCFFSKSFSLFNFLLFASMLGVSIYVKLKLNTYEEWFNKL